MTPNTRFLALLIAALVTTACTDSTDRTEQSAGETAKPTANATSTQTPSSPGNLFRVDYQVIGTPVVGSPVSIDLEITSAFGDEPVDLAFRIPDVTALEMEAAQPRDLRRTPSSGDHRIRERVTVIPQREGRLFINISASRAQDDGTLTSSISIPIHVGNVDTSIRQQGELQTCDTRTYYQTATCRRIGNEHLNPPSRWPADCSLGLKPGLVPAKI